MDAPVGQEEDVAESAAADTQEALPQVKLLRGEPYALQERSLEPVGRSLVPRAEAFLTWIGETERGTRLLTQLKRNGVPRDMALMDERGRALAKMVYVWGVHEAHGFARIHQGGSTDAVVDLASGKVTVPKPRLPDTETADQTMLLGAEASNEVWVVSKAKSKRVFAGLWSDRSAVAVDVKTEIPFWPGCRDARGATLAGSAGTFADFNGHPQTECLAEKGRPVTLGTSLSPECARVDFRPDGSVTCRATTDGDDISGIFFGDWSITLDDRVATELVSPTGAVTPVPMPNIWGVWSDKVLFYAGDDAVLWHPEKSTQLPAGTLEVDESGVMVATLSPETPVLPLSRDDHTAWFDFDAEVVYVHDETLQTEAQYRAVGKRFLATRPETKGVSLHAVDLQARSVRHVADYPDCEADDVRVRELHAGQFAVSCSDIKALRWSEVVDLERGLRGRAKNGWVEQHQLDRDRILISKRTRPVQHTKELRFHAFAE